MSEASYAIIACVMGLGILSYIGYDMYTKRSISEGKKKMTPSPKPAPGKKTHHYEHIRQAALVQEDEFERFYIPILERVKTYQAVIGLEKNAPHFNKTILNALRKRRAAVFDHNSAETNNDMAPFWTLALFSAIACRYVVRLLNTFDYRDHTKRLMNPFLEHPTTLVTVEKTSKTITEQYQPDCCYLHVIEKIIPLSVIRMLVEKDIYPYLINAVTGFYYDRHSPFYTIIEIVEVYESNEQCSSTDIIFKQTLKKILKLIENDVVIKNTVTALVFESTDDLIIDRHLLWELFKTYHVFEKRVLSKKAFEQQLILTLQLEKTALNNETIRIYMHSPRSTLDENDVFYISLVNAIALPYSRLPPYQTSMQLQLKRIKVERKRQSDVSTEIQADHQHAEPDTEDSALHRLLSRKSPQAHTSARKDQKKALFDHDPHNIK